MIVERIIEDCTVTNGNRETELDVHLLYDPADPFAVRLTLFECGEKIEWSLSRDVFIDAVDRTRCAGKVKECGGGDATFFTSPLTVRVLLHNPREGSGTITFPLSRLRPFVRLTQAEVPVGQEDQHYDADAEINKLLDGTYGRGRHPEGIE